ncbi:hypothetical protein B0H11DRAFT_831593 [Mycena galericulata]|nr:hypothetical protein B0H11DRAFT_831593 [Mycena galericulata]
MLARIWSLSLRCDGPNAQWLEPAGRLVRPASRCRCHVGPRGDNAFCPRDPVPSCFQCTRIILTFLFAVVGFQVRLGLVFQGRSALLPCVLFAAFSVLQTAFVADHAHLSIA